MSVLNFFEAALDVLFYINGVKGFFVVLELKNKKRNF